MTVPWGRAQACGRRFRSGRLDRARDDEGGMKRNQRVMTSRRGGKYHARKYMSSATKVELGRTTRTLMYSVRARDALNTSECLLRSFVTH